MRRHGAADHTERVLVLDSEALSALARPRQLVVATAIRFGGGMVLTHDPGDPTRLAAGHADVAIAAI